MPFTLEDKLVVAITSRALFELEDANKIFEQEGLDAYRQYQKANENVQLQPGTGFPLVKALLGINDRAGEHLVEVILLSRNDADSGLRIWNSIEHCKLNISQAAFTDSRNPFEYLEPLYCNLFLSAERRDVVGALRTGYPAALVYRPPEEVSLDSREVRIAFDGDAVLFSEESEKVFQEKGLEAFQQYEKLLEKTP